MYRDSRYPRAFDTGSTRMGKLPPMLFITNRKTPTVVDRTDSGTISTRIANTIPNHISAVAKEEGYISHTHLNLTLHSTQIILSFSL